MNYSSWSSSKLEDVLETLIDYRGKTPRKTDAGIPLITAKIVKQGFIQEPDEFIDPADYDSWMVRGLPKTGDVVLTTEAPLGEVAQLSNANVALAQRIVTLRGKANVLDNSFLKYFLQSSIGQQRLLERQTGTTVTGIKQSELRKVKINYPPIKEQKRIAGILSALDEKIELNRQTNATLEAMAQAIFKEWFVNEEVTSDWELVAFPEIIDLNPSRYIKRDELAPYLDMANVPTEGHRAIEWREREFSSGTRFANGDTLLARITPCLENGKTAFVDFLNNDEVGWGSTEFIVLRPKPPFPPAYGYYLARSKELRKHAILNMVGSSGRQRVPTSSFDNFLIPLPPIELAEKFGSFAEDLMNMIRANDNQSRTLANIRDTLLPKLMRGEIVV